MDHTYASIAEFNDFLRDNGSVSYASEAATIVSRKLAILEASSRRIEAYCARSRFGSGFGPRIGTNRYTPDGRATLYLYDDLLSITSVDVRDAITSDAITYTDETDFYKQPFDRAPYRSLYVHGNGASRFPVVPRGTGITGKWGYADTRRTATATASAIADATTTSITVSDDAEFSAGQTLLIGSEQLYVRALAGSNVLTVERGANGTTAATHDATAIDIYEYPASVADCANRIALLRWRSRDAGADGSDGGGDMPTVVPRRTEISILRASVGYLAFPVIA
jgi:hypothetical protein